MPTRTKADRSAAAKKGAATRKRNQAAAAAARGRGSRPSRPATRSSTPPRQPGRPRRPRSAPWRNGPTPRPRSASRPPSARRDASRQRTRPEPGQAGRRRLKRVGAQLFLPGDRVLELGLVHLRPALDAEAAGPRCRAGRESGRAARAVPERRPPRRPDEMSSVEVRERVRDSPDRARSLLTVRAAISSARDSDRPCFLTDDLISSYWRARLVPGLTPRGGIRASPSKRVERSGR